MLTRTSNKSIQPTNSPVQLDSALSNPTHLQALHSTYHPLHPPHSNLLNSLPTPFTSPTMPSIHANLECLANLPQYKTEKPYGALLTNGKELSSQGHILDTINFTYHRHEIIDIKSDPSITLSKQGFQVHKHLSTITTPSELGTLDGTRRYAEETEEWLKERLDAVFVHTYDVRTRLNDDTPRSNVDVLNTLMPEPRARGAHNDVSLQSGPEIVMNNVIDGQLELLKPGYRVRIVNTWRPLLPVLKDNPLAVCDASTIDPQDLVPTDRVYPHSVGEVYYLLYNKNQRWCWVEDQTPEDVLIMTQYDSHPNGDARCCPHISFANERAPADAPPRRSVETRSIVISKRK